MQSIPGRPLSLDLRQRIVAAHLDGATYEEIAARLAVSPASVSRVLRLYRETGQVAPRPHGGGHPARITDEELPALLELVASHPDATQHELTIAWEEIHGVALSRSSMARAMERAKLTWKKNASGHGRSSAKTSRLLGKSF